MPSITFTGSLAGNFTITAGGVTPSVATATPTNEVVAGVSTFARLTVDVPAPREPTAIRRVRHGLSFDIPTPVLIKGRPYTPKYVGGIGVSATVLQGTGHITTFRDPDPVWNGSSYTPAPPTVPTGANFLRWSVRDLPDPGSFYLGEYRLGAASTKDGTSGIAAGAQQWSASPGSSFAVPWNSAYPFKPTVRHSYHYGRDGSRYYEPAAVHFTRDQVAHMWADFGTILSGQYTMLMVMIPTTIPAIGTNNNVLDSGDDPTSHVTTAQRDAWLASGVGGPVAIPENFGYRTALKISRTDLWYWNDQVRTTRRGIVPLASNAKPRMIGFVMNGSQSRVLAYSPRRYYIKRMTLADHGAQRLMVMGRDNAIIDPRSGSDMIVFEIRMWDKALTDVQLGAQYASLSSTWKFNSYR